MMKRTISMLGILALAVPALLGPRPAAAEEAAARKRVAILNFEFGTVSRWWGGDWDIGRGIADLTVTNLVKDGSYAVVERKALEAILSEQEFNNSNRADPRTASKIGKLLGVNAIIVGSVTQFGFDDKNIRLDAIGGKLGVGGGLLGIGKKKSKAIVVVDARMVDVNTGEILAVATGKGESRRDSFTGFGAGAGGRGFGGAGIDMSSSNFQNTIIGEATRKCVEALCVELVKGQDRIVGTKVELAGRVADVDSSTLIINIGKDQGVKVGDVLNVERVVREVKDPDSGEVLREVTEVIGTLKITEVDARSAVGTFTGGMPPKVGDRIKSR
jgi:curli biogenesis system outer membrane secretion channel CsgG